MRGTTVIARCYMDIPAVLKVWEEIGNCVLLSTEQNFHRLLTGLEADAPVGFSMDCVYLCDDKTVADCGSINWSLLQKLAALSR